MKIYLNHTTTERTIKEDEAMIMYRRGDKLEVLTMDDNGVMLSAEFITKWKEADRFEGQIFIIDGDIFEDARSAAEYIMENCDDSYYDEMLDECYEEANVCGYSYSPSVALYRLDPVAYNCGRSDWEDSMASDLEYEFERMSDGEIWTGYDFTVLCEEYFEEEEEEEEEADV